MARGRKQFEPTPEQRDRVQTLAGFGIPHESIAKHLKISYPTLAKYFQEELQQGVTKANEAVVANLHRLASKSKNPVAAMFWCKTRMQWRENTPPQELKSEPLKVEFKRGPEPARLRVVKPDDKKNGTTGD